MTMLIEQAAKAKKALLAAASVLVALSAAEGVPSNVKGWIATALGILATYGVVYRAKNVT